MKTTIIIPYNKDRGYLAEAIKSAEGQGVIIESQSDNSVGYNVNRALEQVKTPYYCVLAEDDKLTSQAIKHREESIESGNYDFIHSRGVVLGTAETIPWIFPDPTLEEMIRYNRICGSTTLYKTSCGYWDESLTTGEEYDYHLRLLSEGKRLGFLDNITFMYRRHDQQKSLGNVSREYQMKRAGVIEGIKLRYKK